MIRATTGGVLKGYRSNLMKSFVTLNRARDGVLTGRNFLSYAEDPASAAQSFQLRRAFMRVSGQYSNSSSTIRKFESAWSSLESVVQTTNNAHKSALESLEDSYGSGRSALGQQLLQLSESITQTMNAKYGDKFVFAGADEGNVPFSWEGEGENRKLYYRGVPVDAAIPEIQTQADGTPVVNGAGNYLAPDGTEVLKADYDKAKSDVEKLEYMSKEDNFVDLGLGLQEGGDGLVKSSAFNVSLQGIRFLGHGTDADGDPKSIPSILHRMGTILSRCDKDSGEWGKEGDREELERLTSKLEDARNGLREQYVEMDAKADFLKGNDRQLKATSNTLNAQIMGIEKCDLADAITSFSWAQFCYNASLKAGNSILSQSLMDYLN